MDKRKRAIVGAVGLVLALGACTTKNVDEAHVGVGYTKGPIEGEKFDGVIDPGGSRIVFNDEVYELPARQVTYISGSAEGADSGPLTLTAADGEKMNVELTVRFFLNTREDALKPFFLEICQKYDCWGDEGWVEMLRDTFGNPQQAVINDIGLNYDASELRYDNEVKDAFASEFATTFVDSLGRLVGRDDYFCGPGYKKSEEESCPALSVEVNSVSYQRPELESIREDQVLAQEQVELAVQQEAAAAAEARVAAARATPATIALMEAEAMAACAEKPECRLTFVVGDEPVGLSVPVG